MKQIIKDFRKKSLIIKFLKLDRAFNKDTFVSKTTLFAYKDILNKLKMQET